MNDLRKYTREFLTEFIDLYKSLPAVWKVKSKEYSNGDMKTKAYDVLVTKWQEVEPTADIYFVIKKINSIRTVYRRELKKMKNKQSDTNIESSPNLWYFHLLDFLRDQESPKSAKSNKDVESTQFTRKFECKQMLSPVPSSLASPKQLPLTPISSTAVSSSSFASCHLKKRPHNMGDIIPNKASNQLEVPTPQLDRFDYMAKTWSETLKLLPNQQRIIAEKVINDVLFEAQFDTLTRESHLEVHKQLTTNAGMNLTE